MARYRIDIYQPGSPGKDVLHSIESDHPFLAIQRGDLINPRAWPGRARVDALVLVEGGEGTVLRVTGVEHFLGQRGDDLARHTIGVFTETVPDTPAPRS